MITVHLPVSLASEFQSSPVVMVEANTCSEILDALDRKYPGMASWIAEVDGCFRQNLSVFIDGRRLPPRAHASVLVKDGTEMWILQAISGG